jgi:hypothetical protein
MPSGDFYVGGSAERRFAADGRPRGEWRLPDPDRYNLFAPVLSADGRTLIGADGWEGIRARPLLAEMR